MSFVTPGIRDTNARENELGYSAGARKTPGKSWEYSSNIYNQNDADYDSDLYRAAILQRYLRGEGGLKGSVEAYAGGYRPDLAQTAMNKYLAQAGQRREMKGQLAGLGEVQGREERLLTNEANRAVDQGVKRTRENMNRRGLLYGGMREGGEAQVRAQGAATLSANLAGARRDYANQADAIKKSIASIGLANQQQQLEMANQVMESNMRNAIARRQAYQQLGEGVGYAAGAYFNRGQDEGPPPPKMHTGSVADNDYSSVLAPKSYDQIMGR